MGQSILTAHQLAVLEQAAADPRINLDYYFTGGTALSEFYLHHRLSEDLDFFTDVGINPKSIKDFFSENSEKLLIRNIEVHEHHDGMLVIILMFQDGSNLKVDFVYYPFRQIEQGIVWHNLKIDSVFDIAVNKLYTISNRARARDYVDLYQIIISQDILFDQIHDRLNDKFVPFSFDDAPWRGLRLLRVMEQTDYPTIIVPFDKQKMIDFFLNEAKKLERKIFK